MFKLIGLKDRLVHFIKFHRFLILSFVIVLVGIFFIVYAIYEPTRTNSIIIDTRSAEESEMIYSHNNQFISSELNNTPLIKMDIQYKEPIMRGDYLRFNKMCLYAPISSYKEVPHINDIDINLMGYKGSEITTYYRGFSLIDDISGFYDSSLNNKFMNSSNSFYYPSKVKNIPYYDVTNNPFQDTFFKIICTQNWDNSIRINEPNTDGVIEISYVLSGHDVNHDFISAIGKADFYYPMTVLDPIDVINIRINKSLFILNGCLIILGSFPFVLALKQLIE